MSYLLGPINILTLLQSLATKDTKNRGMSSARRTALVACLAALSIGTNYAMLPIPNVKLMDAIVFTTGLFFGLIQGAAVAATAWLVYGTLNPLGVAPPILLTVISSEMIYALAGELLSRTAIGRIGNSAGNFERYVVFGTVGLFATLAYDIVTNAISGLIAYGSVLMGLLTMNVPIPLGIMHEASNFVFFAALTPVLLRLLGKNAVLRDREEKGGN